MSLLLLFNGTAAVVPKDGGGRRVGRGLSFPPLIPMPLAARRVPTHLAEIDEELLLELALNALDEDMLILAALANFEPS